MLNYTRLTESVSKKVERFKIKHNIVSVHYEQTKPNLCYVEAMSERFGLIRTWGDTPKHTFKKCRKLIKDMEKSLLPV